MTTDAIQSSRENPIGTRRRLPVLSDTRMKTWRRCQREHYYAYVLGRIPVRDAEALGFGKLMHLALEAWWGATKDRLFWAMTTIASATSTADNPFTPFDRVHAEELMLGYDTRWGADQWETIAVEQEFRFPLLHPNYGTPSYAWELGGKIDVVARRSDGAIVIIEHKTSSGDFTPGSSYWTRLRLDGQVSVYFRAAQALGYDVEECVYDVIGKSGKEQLRATPTDRRKYRRDGEIYASQRERDETAEEYRQRVREDICSAPSEFYQRGSVVRLDRELAEFDLELWATAYAISMSNMQGIAPRNPDACQRYGGLCPYFAVCTGAADIDDQNLFKAKDAK